MTDLLKSQFIPIPQAILCETCNAITDAAVCPGCASANHLASLANIINRPAPPIPRRLQRKRTAGWRAPESAITVGRPSRWGNPYRIGTPVLCRIAGGYNLVPTVAEAVNLFRARFNAQSSGIEALRLVREARAELAGRDLLCWCPLCPRHQQGRPWNEPCPDCPPCHADVLLEVANSPEVQP